MFFLTHSCYDTDNFVGEETAASNFSDGQSLY